DVDRNHAERGGARLHCRRCSMGSGRRSDHVHPYSGARRCRGIGRARPHPAILSSHGDRRRRRGKRDAGLKMLDLLALVPAFPLFGFAILFITAGTLPRGWIAAIGVGSVGISAILALIVAAGFLSAQQPYTQIVWRWMAIGGFNSAVGFYLDALSVVMMLVVTFVSFLIHLYSAEFMADDEGYSRY